MKYFLCIDNQTVGPLDVSRITELFLNGAITAATPMQPESADNGGEWKPLGEIFPTIAALTTRAAPASPHPQHVTVADIDMPFFSMVGFMVKWAIASIPATLILAAVVGFALVIGGILFGGVFAAFAR